MRASRADSALISARLSAFRRSLRLYPWAGALRAA